MARARLSSPDQPLGVRFLLRLFEGLASLKLAVVLIAASAALLGAATFLEKYLGTEAVLFGVYRTWWFVALNVLLFLNVLCAALIRFPWKRHQTGFLVTHTGILVLLVGCLVTRLGGIDSHLSVYEDGTAQTAYKSSQHFELVVHPYSDPGTDRSEPSVPQTNGSPAAQSEAAEPMVVPFAPGPFNWSDYGRWYLFPWRLAGRDRGVLFDRDRVRLEVLDYYSDWSPQPAPPLVLRFKAPAAEDASARGRDSTGDWETVKLSAQGMASPHVRAGTGNRQERPGGEQVVFWVGGSQAETDAFLASSPEEPLGKLGLVILHAAGKKYCLPLDDWQPGKRKTLGDSGFAVELAQASPARRLITLAVCAPGETPRRLLLFSDYPDANVHDQEHGVFGTYWRAQGTDAPQGKAGEPPGGELRGPDRPRIDILQGADQKLYYRAWRPPHVEAIGPLPADGAKVVSFAKSGSPLTWYVERFVPHDLPGVIVKPNLLTLGKPPRPSMPQRALVRLTVDGRSEEFWLQGFYGGSSERPLSQIERRVAQGDRRRVAVTLRRDAIKLGFEVRLNKFNRLLDPGSEKVSQYSSEVDLCERHDPNATLQKDVLITLNQPVTVTDSQSGHSYRLYQLDFDGPFRPGDRQFEERLGPNTTRRELFLSTLSVNYDPGRGLKYAGTLLIFVGFVIIYYMRAYFLKKRNGGL